MYPKMLLGPQSSQSKLGQFNLETRGDLGGISPFKKH